jgi:hypothetical protein
MLTAGSNLANTPDHGAAAHQVAAAAPAILWGLAGVAAGGVGAFGAGALVGAIGAAVGLDATVTVIAGSVVGGYVGSEVGGAVGSYGGPGGRLIGSVGGAIVGGCTGSAGAVVGYDVTAQILAAPVEAQVPGGYLAGKGPAQVEPGVTQLSGQYVNDLGRVEPWTAYYDEYGRMIARTDYNAGNVTDGIPSVHYHVYEYNAEFPFGHEIQSHVPGEYVITN